ncbi:MAG TPA: glycosyltransferase family 4 protein [Acidimicrobiia bacterium]
MKVAVVCPYDLGFPGGVQHQVAQLVVHLRASGEDAWAVGPRCPADLGVDIGNSVEVPANGSKAPVALNPGVAGRVRKAVRDAQVIHIHEPLMPLTSFAALTVPNPKVTTFHARPPTWVRSLYRVASSPMRRSIGSGIVTAVSAEAAAALPFDDVRMIPNGIDLETIDVAKTRQQVVFVGRDEPRKGLDTLLKAWPNVMEVHPGARLTVVGSMRQSPPVGVVFLGRVPEDEKNDLLATAEVLVAPNLGGESFGIVLLEGMAAGCAVVASDLPAFHELLAGVGVEFPAGDSGSLAEHLVRLLASREELDRLGSAGRTRAAEFAWPRVLGLYLTAYEDATAKAATRSR